MFGHQFAKPYHHQHGICAEVICLNGNPSEINDLVCAICTIFTPGCVLGCCIYLIKIIIIMIIIIGGGYLKSVSPSGFDLRIMSSSQVFTEDSKFTVPLWGLLCALWVCPKINNVPFGSTLDSGYISVCTYGAVYKQTCAIYKGFNIDIDMICGYLSGAVQ